MAQIISIHPDHSQLVFLDELPPLTDSNLERIKSKCFPKNLKKR